MSGYTSLQEVAGIVFEASGERHTVETTMSDLIESMYTTENATLGDERYVLTKEGFRQLTDKLALPFPMFNHIGITNNTQMQVLTDCVKNQDSKIILKVSSGNRVYAILGQEYAIYDNAMLMTSLLRMQASGDLPEETRVMAYGISPDARSMNLRLVSPSNWDFSIGENGSSQRFLGNLVISNDESAQGKFRAQVAVTRNACLNTTIGQSILDLDYQFSDAEEFHGALSRSAGKINDYAGAMKEELLRMQTVQIESADAIFAKIATELKIPTRIMTEVSRYWEAEGSRDNLYDITQAVVAGTRALAVGNRPNWARRDTIESAAWSTGQALVNMQAGGQDIGEWYLTGEIGTREMCARYVDSFAGEVDGIENIADGIRDLEVSG